MVRSRKKIRALGIIYCFLFFLKLSKGDISQRFVSVRSPPTSMIKNHFATLSKEIRRKSNGIRNSCSIFVSSASSVQREIFTQIKSKTQSILGEVSYFGLSVDYISKNYDQRYKKGGDLYGRKEQSPDMELEMEKDKQELDALRRLAKDKLGYDDDELSRALSGVEFEKIKKQQEWDKIGHEIECWAQRIIDEKMEEEKNGWKEITVSSLCSNYNKDGRIQCHLKWMKDSRGALADQTDDTQYPCIRVCTTIDAPLEKVCQYLADEKSLPEYNALVQKHKDIEEITPHSKICWGQSPKILFIKPRDFLTFCHHRWRRDGTQVVVNQACNHDDYDYVEKNSKKSFKAYALRGANFICPHPEDPNKTSMFIVAHANPGHDISPFLCRLAVSQLVQVEPFKLFYKINQFVQEYESPNDSKVQLVNSNPGRSKRPGGLSQMGYACFWPNGGGLKEEVPRPQNDIFPELENERSNGCSVKKGDALSQNNFTPDEENEVFNGDPLKDAVALPTNDIISDLDHENPYGVRSKEGITLPANDYDSEHEREKPNSVNSKEGAALLPDDMVSEESNHVSLEEAPLLQNNIICGHEHDEKNKDSSTR